MKLKNIFFISIFLIIIISLTSVVYATDNHTTNNSSYVLCLYAGRA